MSGDTQAGSSAEVIVRREGPLGRITLNRPKAINALTPGMVDAIAAALAEWRADPAVKALVLDGAGERGFCAGGDIRLLYDNRPPASDLGIAFWRSEYTLDHAIAVYPKPVVAFMSGLVMGGGAGLSVHASHRVVDGSTRFAMPETGIGLVPDVGASWFLSRCPGETGTWLALTGRAIGAGDLVALGLADLCIPAQARESAIAALASGMAGDSDPARQSREVLARHGTPAGDSQAAAHRGAIDRCFSHDSVEGILAALDAEGTDWAAGTAATIRTKSPVTSKIALRALRLGRAAPDLAACLATEFRIVSRIAGHAEFYEGVRAAVIDKDRAPKWHPARLEDVSEAIVEAYFAPLPHELALPPAS